MLKLHFPSISNSLVTGKLDSFPSMISSADTKDKEGQKTEITIFEWYANVYNMQIKFLFSDLNEVINWVVLLLSSTFFVLD